MATPIALPPIVNALTGVPYTGGPDSFILRAWHAGSPHATPPVLQVGSSNLYTLNPTDEDEELGLIVEVDAGSTNFPRYSVFSVTKPASQLFAYGLYNGDGSRWEGAGGTVAEWTGLDELVISKLDHGVFVATPSPGDVENGAQGLITAPEDAYPEALSLSTEPLGEGGGGVSDFLITTVTPVDDYTLNVTFSRAARVNGQLFVPTNFAISVRVGEANETYVEQVRLLSTGSPSSTHQVQLKLFTPMTRGGRYALRVDNLSDANNVPVSPPVKPF